MHIKSISIPYGAFFSPPSFPYASLFHDPLQQQQSLSRGLNRLVFLHIQITTQKHHLHVCNRTAHVWKVPEVSKDRIALHKDIKKQNKNK